jgi:hypothetical protein
LADYTETFFGLLKPAGAMHSSLPRSVLTSLNVSTSMSDVTKKKNYYHRINVVQLKLTTWQTTSLATAFTPIVRFSHTTILPMK